MSWSQIAWLNNKIRIPEQDRRILAAKDAIISVKEGITSHTAGSITFTPKYSGSVCITTNAIISGGTIDSGITALYINNKLMDVSEHQEYTDTTNNNIICVDYYYIPVTAGISTQIDVTTQKSSEAFKVLLCGVVVEGGIA